MYAITPEGEGQVVETEKSRMTTSYLVKGAGFEGWYRQSEIQIIAGDTNPVQPDPPAPSHKKLKTINPAIPWNDEPLYTQDPEDDSDQMEFVDIKPSKSLNYDTPTGKSVFAAHDDEWQEVEDDDDEMYEDEDSNESGEAEFIKSASWFDVRSKAQKLRSLGNVHVSGHDRSFIYGKVKGYHGTYDVLISRLGMAPSDPSDKVSNWACTCTWGKYAWNREKYFGRMCSHACAMYFDMQSLYNRKKKSSAFSNWPMSIEASEVSDSDFADHVVYSGDPDQDGDDDQSSHYDEVDTTNVTDEDLLGEEVPHEDEDVDLVGEEVPHEYDDDETKTASRPNLSDKEKSVEDGSENLEISDILAEFQKNADNGALGETSGGGGLDFAGAAQEYLQRTAGKNYTPMEQVALIEEEGVASNLGDLNLKGTHYTL